ncbi:5092_t:CDS:2, partial [Ambispora leptoticha]
DILAAVPKLKNLSTLHVHFQTYEVDPLLDDELKKIAEACPSLYYIKWHLQDHYPKKSSNAEDATKAEETDGLEALRAMLPTSFGFKKNTKVSTEAFAKTRRKEEKAK